MQTVNLVRQGAACAIGLILLAGCGGQLSASATCGEISRLSIGAAAGQTLVLTSDLSGFPGRDLYVIWLCNVAELCDPVLSYNDPRGVAAQWRGPDVLEIVTDARAPRLWPAPPAPRNAPWPNVRLHKVDRNTRASPSLVSHLTPSDGAVLTNSGVTCRPIRKFGA